VLRQQGAEGVARAPLLAPPVLTLALALLALSHHQSPAPTANQNRR
jgi:hypothetical protein